MSKERLNDMLERYGEVCHQKTAGKILSVDPRTICRMMREGRLRRVGRGVDVRSIYEYIENRATMDYEARVRNTHPKGEISRAEFLAAAKVGKWASRALNGKGRGN